MLRGSLGPPLARMGVILPSSNRWIEPQFQYYAPSGLALHFERARITGPWDKPVREHKPEIARAAAVLSDSKPDLIVFNCTGTSMKEGRAGDAFLLDVIRNETGIEAISTAGAVVDALNALRIKRLVLITPYIQKTNNHEIAYLRECGIEVAHDVALGLRGGDQYIEVPSDRWIEIARENGRAEADGFFLSCTNTTQIEAIDAIEKETGKPVVQSNQAVLWAATNLLSARIPIGKSSVPGRLNALSIPAESAAE